jgi:hypothetical protein
MATGSPGANGVWLYGEDDSEATFSALLNKAGSTVNTQLGLDRARLTALEGAGRIVNVVSVTRTSPFSVAISPSGGFSGNVTGLEATITPKSTANKILVTVNTTIARSEGRAIGGFRIMRGATVLSVGDAAGSRGRVTSGVYHDFNHPSELSAVSAQLLDSPATTSAITYGIQLYGNGAATFTLNRSGVDNDNATAMRTISTITLIEVAG